MVWDVQFKAASTTSFYFCFLWCIHEGPGQKKKFTTKFNSAFSLYTRYLWLFGSLREPLISIPSVSIQWTQCTAYNDRTARYKCLGNGVIRWFELKLYHLRLYILSWLSVYEYRRFQACANAVMHSMLATSIPLCIYNLYWLLSAIMPDQLPKDEWCEHQE